jgi:hypothetical protein
MAAVIVMPGCAVSGCFSFPVQAGLVMVAGCAWRLLGMEFVGELFIVTHRTRTEAGIGRIISFLLKKMLRVALDARDEAQSRRLRENANLFPMIPAGFQQLREKRCGK